MFPIIDGKEYIPHTANGHRVAVMLASGEKTALTQKERADLASYLEAAQQTVVDVSKLTEFMSTDFLGLKHAKFYGASCITTAIHFLKTHPERQGK